MSALLKTSVLLLTLLVASCGQKGPLEHPEETSRSAGVVVTG